MEYPEGWVERWRRVGLCTEPADRGKAEESLRMVYRAAGQPGPQEVLWAGSPAELKSRIKELWRVRCMDPPPIYNDLLCDVVDGRCRTRFYSACQELHRDVWVNVGSHVHGVPYMDAQHDAPWVCNYVHYSEAMGLRRTAERIRGFVGLTESCGHYTARVGVVVLSERHTTLSLDPEGRLHSESGMAIAYPDGWGLWMIHGVKVDEQVATAPETQDLAQVVNEVNLEVRRTRIERWAGRGTDASDGWHRFLRETRARVVDRRRNDAEATDEALVRVDTFTWSTSVLVCGCPSTGRVYCLEVAPEVGTCEEAQAWLSGGLASRVISAA